MQAVPLVIPSEAAHPDPETRLREFARQLAETQSLEPGRRQKSDLLERLQSWEQALRNANAFFKAMPSRDMPVSRAGEWMLDNYNVVKQTFHQIAEALPASFLDQLPKLSGTSPEPGIPSPAPTKAVGTLQKPGLPRGMIQSRPLHFAFQKTY